MFKGPRSIFIERAVKRIWSGESIKLTTSTVYKNKTNDGVKSGVKRKRSSNKMLPSDAKK